jgi:hypothetical protein
MNKKIIAFMAMVLFLSAISYSEDKTLTRRDYVEVIKQKDEEIANLKTALMEKAKLLKQKDEEINRLKELCHKSGINTSPPSEETVVPEPSGKIKIIDKPIFGVRLGEDIAELAKKCSVEFIKDVSGLGKLYRVKSESPNVKALLVSAFADKISSITVLLTDNSESNYNAIVKGIETKYAVVDEEKPISMDKEHNFAVRIDGEDVFIKVMLEKKFMESDQLSILYGYQKLANLAGKVEEDKKASKIDNEL